MRQICHWLAVIVVALFCAAQTITIRAAAGAIQTISPAAGRAGDVVTITGQGFGAFNVRITVGGVRADVVSANGNRVNFRIPAGLPAGLTSVVATNPGGHAGTIAFRVVEGILLAGGASAPAISATTDLRPVAVGASDIVNGILMTRLDLRFRPGATIGQVNAALGAVEGGIVTMIRGQPAVTIAIPRPADVAALGRVVDTLNRLPGISRATLAREAHGKRLPGAASGSDLDQILYLIPTGFPAAWNASHLATDGCASRKVKVVVADDFETASFTGFFDEIPRSTFHLLVTPTTLSNHGDEVTTTLAAKFEGANPTGAVPFPECLDIEAIAMDGLSSLQRIITLSQLFPAGKFLLNYSMGYSDALTCLDQGGCNPSDPLAELDLPVNRAYDATDWKQYTSDRWDDFLVNVAAGNELSLPGTAFYPGLGVAAFDSFMSVATLEPSFAFVQDASQWDPQAQPSAGQLDSLTADAIEKAALDQYIASFGSKAGGVPENVLMVGATERGATMELLTARPYSDSGPDVSAVGEKVFTLTSGLTEGGTSLATPQVTGLAAYLWLLSSGAHAKNPALADLSAQPSSVTRRAILANAGIGLGVNVIDAYSTVLSLDGATGPGPATMPVRLALLDVLDDNGRFDENDLAVFVTAYFDGTTGEPVEPSRRTFSRFDLNGDGYTGGSRTARFDLDRSARFDPAGVGSTQFGAPFYSQVLEDIGPDRIAFNENALTDVQILCYYAYSPMYTPRDEEVREQLLAGRCAPITVDVAPPSVSLTAGASQQFAATVHGTTDPRVTWSAAGGTITPTGLFTAGNTGGAFTVRATSVMDPNAFGDATVTITAAAGTFFGQQQVSIRTSAMNPGTFEFLANESRQADNIFTANPLLPIALDVPGSYHAPDLGNGTFRLKADATFLHASQFFVPASNTHTANVSCTTTSDAAGPKTGSNASGHIHVSALANDGRTPADMTIVLTGLLSRGPGTGDLEGNVSYSGDVTVSWTSAGVAQPDIKVKAAGYSGSDGNQQVDTAIGRTLDIKAPGFVEIDWNLVAACQSGGDEQNSAVGSTGGSLSLGYILRR